MSANQDTTADQAANHTGPAESRSVEKRVPPEVIFTTRVMDDGLGEPRRLDPEELGRYGKTIKNRLRLAQRKGAVDDRDALAVASDTNDFVKESAGEAELTLLIPAPRPVGPNGALDAKYLLTLRSPRTGHACVLLRTSKRDFDRHVALLREEYACYPDLRIAINLLGVVSARFFEFVEAK